MKHIALLLAIAILCPFLFSSCIKEEDHPEEVVTIGLQLPDFMVTMNDSSIVTGSELRGTVSVVMFFHTGCPDCQQALPRVQRLYDEYVSQGVAFALISREEDDASIAAYWAEQGFTMPYSAQADRKVYELFAYKRVPRIYVSERGGTVRHIFTDDPVPSYEDLEDSLIDVLGE